MEIRMVHNGRDRDSLLMPMDDRTVDLMLQYSIQLIRCEPTTRVTEFRTVGTTPPGTVSCMTGPISFISIRGRMPSGRPFVTISFESSCATGTENSSSRQAGHGTRRATRPARLLHRRSPAAFPSAWWMPPDRRTSGSSSPRPGRRISARSPGPSTGLDSSLIATSRSIGTRDGRESAVSGTASASCRLRSCTSSGTRSACITSAAGANADANYGITLDNRNELMGMGDHATARLAQPWISQLQHHLIPARTEAAVRFTARVVAPQLITYWDNDWAPPATATP